jgi:exodeoxyribonuclease VII large subunit
MFETLESAPNPEDSKSAQTPAVLTVEQLNSQIRKTLEGQFSLVWVQGEISGFKAHSSGHFYFQLKDSKASIKAVMFRGFNSRLKFKPHDGLEVLIRARVTVYEPRGDYQINVEMMEPVGAGALQKAFEQLKAKLLAEGLFSADRKRPLPSFPKKLVVVTSPTGAVIQDILNVITRRNKFIEIILVPTIVQGEAAAASICEAMNKAFRIPDVDVMIVGRGGGSMEDLWCFNNESVARLIAQSPFPVVSAVGHEVDFTIADFVADVRAPTPSAAAELVVKNISDVTDRLIQQHRLLELGWSKLLRQAKMRFQMLGHRLIDPRRRLLEMVQRNDELHERLVLAIKNYFRQADSQRQLLVGRLVSPLRVVEKLQHRNQWALSSLLKSMQNLISDSKSQIRERMSLLDSLSPLNTVDRGYAIVSKKGQVIKSKNQVKEKEIIEISVADGWIKSEVLSTHASNEKGDFPWTLKRN